MGSSKPHLACYIFYSVDNCIYRCKKQFIKGEIYTYRYFSHSNNNDINSKK